MKKKQNKTQGFGDMHDTLSCEALHKLNTEGFEPWMWISVKTVQSQGVGMYKVYDIERKQGEEALSGL